MLWHVIALLATSQADWPELKARGTLRVLVFGADEDFLPRAGSPKARDRALLAELAEREGLTVEFITEPEFERLFTRLRSGDGDVIAHGLTIAPERKKVVAFTRPVATVSQWLIGKKGAGARPQSPADLSGVAVTVHANSAYATTLASLGAVVKPADEALDSEGLVYQVGRGALPFTVTDSNVFASISTYNPDVEALFPIAEGKELAWAVRPDAVKLKAVLDAFLVQKALTAHTQRLSTGDLDAIRSRGSLRVLTWNDPVSYFAYQGELFGFDYELARLLAAKLKVRLELIVPPSRADLVPWLLDGHGDLIAAGLHPFVQEGVAFTKPYAFTDELAIDDSVPSAHQPHLSDDVALLQSGRATIADRLLIDAMPNAPTNLRTVFSERPVAYAVRTSAPKLRDAVDDFITSTYRGLDYNVLRKRYFEANHRIDAARANETTTTGQLSPFDALFKEHATRVGLDWRLLAAQCFQESRFDPKATSWAGAVGLCQLMPATAKELGVTRREDPAQSVRAGADYLAKLIARVDSRVELNQRVRFALSAYNVGPSHLADAQRLAAERGLDPYKWFGHVEKAMVLLEQPAFYRRAKHGYCRGSEPVKYVSEIQARYDRYVSLVP